jgi:hypothetical protein
VRRSVEYFRGGPKLDNAARVQDRHSVAETAGDVWVACGQEETEPPRLFCGKRSSDETSIGAGASDFGCVKQNQAWADDQTPGEVNALTFARTELVSRGVQKAGGEPETF